MVFPINSVKQALYLYSIAHNIYLQYSTTCSIQSDLNYQLRLGNWPNIIHTQYTCTLSVTVKFSFPQGDSTAYTFEVVEDTPYFYPLSPYKATSLHQALAFLPKIACDVKGVEFAKGYRVTQTTIEPLSFTMPRIKVGSNPP